MRKEIDFTNSQLIDAESPTTEASQIRQISYVDPVSFATTPAASAPVPTTPAAQSSTVAQIVANPPPPNTIYSFTVRDQAFDVVLHSLQPSTEHYLYLNGLLSTNSSTTTVVPLGGKAGDSLITDTNGGLAFTMYWQAISPTETGGVLDEMNAKLAGVVGTKTLVVCNLHYPNGVLPSSYKNDVVSEWSGVIFVDVAWPSSTDVSYIAGSVSSNESSGDGFSGMSPDTEGNSIGGGSMGSNSVDGGFGAVGDDNGTGTAFG